ncbi:uppS [Symbiodinium sp. CCMP2456]|nr:uppS [Symbiodinium sp. CCMP2456]
MKAEAHGVSGRSFTKEECLSGDLLVALLRGRPPGPPTPELRDLAWRLLSAMPLVGLALEDVLQLPEVLGHSWATYELLVGFGHDSLQASRASGLTGPVDSWGVAMEICRRRRREDVRDSGGPGGSVFGRLHAALHAALRAVGAAGGGWALLAALRAIGKHSKEPQDEALGQKTDQGSGKGLKGPRHVAVIMDGNRRFGRRVHGDALSGHRAGGEKLREFLLWSVELGVEFLTVFAFSTENWKRDPEEVAAMMRLFLSEVPRLQDHALRNNVRVRFLVSDAEPLPADVRCAISELEKRSSSMTGLLLNVCLSYGGRCDVSQACRALAEQVKKGELEPSEIDDGMVKQHLLTADVPDPDVLIRTSGERRLSNFMMFQLAYAELFFLEKHWPEVTQQDFGDIVSQFQKRQRRFGK